MSLKMLLLLIMSVCAGVVHCGVTAGCWAGLITADDWLIDWLIDWLMVNLCMTMSFMTSLPVESLHISSTTFKPFKVIQGHRWLIDWVMVNLCMTKWPMSFMTSVPVELFTGPSSIIWTDWLAGCDVTAFMQLYNWNWAWLYHMARCFQTCTWRAASLMPCVCVC